MKYWKLDGKEGGREVDFYLSTSKCIVAEDEQAKAGSFVRLGRMQARNTSLAVETAFVSGVSNFLILSGRNIAITEVREVHQIPDCRKLDIVRGQVHGEVYAVQLWTDGS
ncbi:hypothetical protein OJ996_05190 [Luteolibacter sp. GHJ8]|uniref:Uncharacterized protein n=1 Tax=Luteolibacter rhizosphaerae TaxID=2989719 RepID=A0ABT3FZD4_9BACT|nr:hypothetical protein [Luteolibacter rhizosphaerae]MCW1912955.1 hypothetical protein [Luteolibacter rhizosphaerae]